MPMKSFEDYFEDKTGRKAPKIEISDEDDDTEREGEDIVPDEDEDVEHLDKVLSLKDFITKKK